MAIGSIVIKLDLDDKNFKGSISGAGRDVRRFQKAVKDSSSTLAKNEGHHRTWARTLRDSVIVLGLARHAIENVSAALFSFPRAVIRSNAELERMTALMTGLSTETGGMAAAQADATKNVQAMFDMAKRAPFEVGAITDAFVKMKAVGLDPMDGMLQGLVDSVAKFGGTPEQLKRASIAIQQMAGKGVISMEELRQQLGESVPDAIQIMARSMGVSMGELVEKVSSGTVEAKNALKAMARQMNIENAGAALRMSETWDGMINRMKTSLTLAAKEIGDAGFFDAVKEQLSFIVDDTLQDPRFFSFMRDVGQAMASMVQSAASLIGTLYEFRGVIVDVGQALLALLVVRKVQKYWEVWAEGAKAAKRGLMTLGPAYANLSAEIAASNLHVRQHNWAIAQSVVPARNKSAALEALTIVTNRATTALRTFFAAIGGWATVAMVGIPLVIAAFDRLQDKTASLVRDIDTSRPELITKEQLTAIDDAITKFDKLQKEMNELEEQRSRLSPDSPLYQALGVKTMTKQQKQDEFAEIAEHGENRRKSRKAQLIAEQALIEQALGSFMRTSETGLRAELRESVNEYREQLNALIARQGEMSEEEFIKSRVDAENVLAEQTRRQFDRLIAVEQSELAKQSRLQTDEAKKQVEIQRLKIAQLKKLRDEGLKVFDGTVYEIETISKKDAKKELDTLEQFLLASSKKLAKYRAKSGEENPYMAEFEAMAAMDKFGDSTAQELEKARKLMVELWEARKKWDSENAETQAFGDALERIDGLTGQINDKFAQRTNQNPLLRDSIEAEKLKGRLREVAAEIEALNTIDADQKGEALARLSQLSRQVEVNARTATVEQIRSATQAMNQELLPEMQRIEAQYAALRQAAYEWRMEQGELSPEELKAFHAYLKAINDRMAKDMQTPMDELVEQWSDGTAQMQAVWVNATTSFVDTLTDSLMEGKLQLADFVEEFGRMVIKMQMQKAAAGIISGLGGMLGGAPTGLANNLSTVHPGGYAALANGGIMTSKGLAQLETYSNGGIADRPQIALYGEGRQPEAYVPLPDGRSIPVTMTGAGGGGGNQAPAISFNVINQSGQPVEADGGEPRFDGKQWVLDVVLNGLNRPGNFRSGMKSALKK